MPDEKYKNKKGYEKLFMNDFQGRFTQFPVHLILFIRYKSAAMSIFYPGFKLGIIYYF
ncbi:MAG: hypothetical protein H7Y01_04610 [Ferruginibacter sp.]|nr:hypothetical protein [Chitinophagaceae bacterium]